MVKKLGLKTEDHSQPCQVWWLVKGNILKVNKRCSVQFSIGKRYSDEVWCDVVQMEAHHLLLSRPWMFDRTVKHDEFKNTCTFRKDGAFDSIPVNKIRICRCCKRSEPCTHRRRAYADVLSATIHSGLPPMRDIQHCIYLVPGSAIPNKASYRLQPKELEELQSQVLELVEKGVIREKMSPCAVAVLMVPKANGSMNHRREKTAHLFTEHLIESIKCSIKPEILYQLHQKERKCSKASEYKRRNTKEKGMKNRIGETKKIEKFNG